MPKVLELPVLEEAKSREEWLELVAEQLKASVQEIAPLWDFAEDIVESMGDIFYDPEAFHDGDNTPMWYGKSPNIKVLAQARRQVFAGLLQVNFNMLYQKE